MQARKQTESDRIRNVYAEYGKQGWAKSKWSAENSGNQEILREREQKIAGMLSATGFMPLRERRILEVGCGSGTVLRGLVNLGATPDNCYGVDLLPERIEKAKRACPGIRFLVANAEKLPDEYGKFDIVVAFTVFSSILDEATSRNIATGIERVMRSGGGVLWYDFRYDNPFNPNVRRMTQSYVRKLFPNYRHHYQSLTLFPQLARQLGRLAPAIYPILVRAPFLRTHLLGLLIKP